VENVAVPAKQHNLAATIAVEIASPAAVQWRPSPGWKYIRVHSMLTVYVCVSLFANPGHVFFTQISFFCKMGTSLVQKKRVSYRASTRT